MRSAGLKTRERAFPSIGMLQGLLFPSVVQHDGLCRPVLGEGLVRHSSRKLRGVDVFLASSSPREPLPGFSLSQVAGPDDAGVSVHLEARVTA
jgi:hypothetical protein